MPIRLQLSLFAETFAVCRLGAEEPIPSALLKADLVSITRTADELSIVCAADAAPAHAQCEKGWRALKVHGPLPFSMTTTTSRASRDPCGLTGVDSPVVSAPAPRVGT